MLPDGDSCVHLPDGDDGAPEAESAPNAHRQAWGGWTVYDEIPRRPERAEDYGAYRYPLPYRPGIVVSGYDLDRPEEMQRHQRERVGHGAIDLAAPRGTPVTLVALDHQQGDAQVLFVGPLFGTTVVTRHAVREGGALRDYLVLFGHLSSPAAGLIDHVGASVRDGDVIGYVGDSGSPGRVHLHFETRRLRDGLDAMHLAPNAMVDGASTVVCDPRNVLPPASSVTPPR
jgi:murein DD-endopeptidase MepM/ murein hydrolase activator NlpD